MNHILKNHLFFCLTAFIFTLSHTAIFAADAPVRENPFSSESTDFTRWCPRIPTDALMPAEADIQKIADWTQKAFTATASVPAEKADEPFSLELLRQDHATLKFGLSCMGTPLKIGSQDYSSGLGTHANSKIRITFAEPITRFTTEVGVDNNYDTGGTRGSVQFAVLVSAGTEDEKEIFRTPTRRGSDDALKIDIPLPENTTVLTLVTDMTEDGPAHDQADWCVPAAVGVSGKAYDLGAAKFTAELLPAELPFSFTYGGVPSSELLPKWKFAEKPLDALQTAYSWTDPKTGLCVTAVVRRFERFAAADWVLFFENMGKKDTPLLENVQAANFVINWDGDDHPIILNTLTGDSCDENSWLPVRHPLRPGDRRTFTPAGGRSSNGAFPFWNLQRRDVADDVPTEGVFVSVGWSGQWKADFYRNSPTDVRVSAGMERISTVLHPGEKIRSPRVLIMPWKADRLSAHVLFRRLMMFEYAPKTADGLPQAMTFAGQCFDRYYRQRKDWEKIAGQKEYAESIHEIGCEAHWFDAAWFPVGFPDGVGNWISDPVNFPGGVEELSDFVHDRLGMKFVLWFEPERVARGSILAREYPQYVFGGENGGLYKLNDPEAREFLTNLLLARIKEFRLDVYRNDFNIDPLGFWQANDAPDRVGMTEIRYVEGHYEMWNRFRQEKPGLWIDNCASGGRRIDLETTSISIPMWRSDTCCWAGNAEWDQNQSIGVNQYLPLYSCCVWDSSPYTVRSGANPGSIIQFNVLDDDFAPAPAKAAIHEAKVLQKFWYGDFYPLTEAKIGKSEIVAWQLHRSDLDAGIIYVFRRPECPYSMRDLKPRAIDPDATYRVTIKRDYDSPVPVEMSGRELISLEIRIPEKRGCVLVEYEKK